MRAVPCVQTARSSFPEKPLQSAAVAGQRVKLLVQDRAVLGSAESRRLRRQGLIPGVLYGRERPHAISIAERDLRNALTGAGGLNAVLDVVIDGGDAHSSVLKDYQLHKVRGTITHVDLQEVRLDQPIHATVSVHLIGEAIGTKEGGVLSQGVSEVNVEALPMDVPALLEFDVSELGVNDTARLDQLVLPEGVTLLDDVETVLAGVSPPAQEEAEVVDEAAAEAVADGESGSAESDAQPDAAED
jgi:large subunit ribosomal protein L25